MLSYEVTLRLEARSLAEAFETYMPRHVAEVFATGCFVDAHFERADDGLYRSRYTVASQAELDRYLTDHAPRLRADFHEHFPTGVVLSRTVWSED
jgi:hypothetical protein